MTDHLSATFAALAVLPILFMAQLAFIVAFGVLLDTLIVRTLLVPAMAIDAGRFTWWPSRLSGRGPYSETPFTMWRPSPRVELIRMSSKGGLPWLRYRLSAE